MGEVNPFELLGVSIQSTPKEVKKAFSELSLLMHPDKGGNKNDMIILQYAYDYVMQQIRWASTSKNNDEIASSTIVSQLEKSFRDFCLEQEAQTPPEIAGETQTNFDTFNRMWDHEHIVNNIPVWGSSYVDGYGSDSKPSTSANEDENEDVDVPVFRNEKSEVIIYQTPDPLLAETTLRQSAPTTIEVLACSRDDYGDGVNLFDYKYAYTTFEMKEMRPIYETIPTMDSLKKLRSQDIIYTKTE